MTNTITRWTRIAIPPYRAGMFRVRSRSVVAIHPDGSLDVRYRFGWREFDGVDWLPYAEFDEYADAELGEDR